MILRFSITKDGIISANEELCNWLVIQEASETELTQIVKKYQLPHDLFIGGDDAEEITHYEKMPNGKLGELTILSLMNLNTAQDLPIEKRLEPLIFVFAHELTITFVGDNSHFIDDFLTQHAQKITSKERLCAYIIKMTYTHYLKELKHIKKEIDALDQAARTTTKNEELFRLADTQRTMVYLDNTLQGQKETLNYLWEETDFPDQLDEPNLLYNIRLRQAHAEERVLIYRDLLETIGGLFNDMMSNNLNHLMKYLDSAALVISVPALISGIWGMNTGGLPGKGTKLGFFFVIILGVILTLLTALHLKRKDYTKTK